MVRAGVLLGGASPLPDNTELDLKVYSAAPHVLPAAGWTGPFLWVLVMAQTQPQGDKDHLLMISRLQPGQLGNPIKCLTPSAFSPAQYQTSQKQRTTKKKKNPRTRCMLGAMGTPVCNTQNNNTCAGHFEKALQRWE